MTCYHTIHVTCNGLIDRIIKDTASLQSGRENDVDRNLILPPSKAIKNKIRRSIKVANLIQ